MGESRRIGYTHGHALESWYASRENEGRREGQASHLIPSLSHHPYPTTVHPVPFTLWGVTRGGKESVSTSAGQDSCLKFAADS